MTPILQILVSPRPGGGSAGAWRSRDLDPTEAPGPNRPRVTSRP